MDIGIDLGTTYSVLAVKGSVELAAGYPPGNYLPECDVTLIPTPNGDFTFPSAVWLDPDEPDHVLVGWEAKQKAEDGFEPIVFSKRSIGTDHVLRCGGQELSAKAAAVYILKYLKSCAETALGQPVERAVITHPAYFELNQIGETRDAAIEAGFDMSCPEQMLMEPVAATYAFVAGVDTDPLRVMTYDLGGGTFDVTILERSQGVVETIAFGGDHLLGGYTFDRKLERWILEQQEAKGRHIAYDDDDPEHRARHQRMLQEAESIKLRLASATTDRMPCNIKIDNVLKDDQQRPVQVIERMTRREYRELIQPELDETIEQCQAALDKAAKVYREERGEEFPGIDRILLVGGSTYGPWVIETLAEAFELELEPYSPDLCVAAGAALRADMLPPPPGRSDRLLLSLQVPPRTLLDAVVVPGRVSSVNGQPLAADERQSLQARLRLPGGQCHGPVPLGNEGEFEFLDVPVGSGGQNTMVAQILDAGGNVVVESEFAVEVGGGDPPAELRLPKQLSYRSGSGVLKPIADEGERLPLRCRTVEARRVFGSGDPTVQIEIYQGDVRVGLVRVTDIPERAGEGAEVQLDLSVSANNVLEGEVRILAPGNQDLVKEEHVVVQLPPFEVPDLETLSNDFVRLRASLEEEVTRTLDPAHRTVLSTKGERLVSAVEDKLREQPPEVLEIAQKLRELDKLLQKPDELSPPKGEFDALLKDCHDILDAKPDDMQLQATRQRLDEIDQKGRDAHGRGDQRAWTRQNELLAALGRQLQQAGTVTPPPPEDLPPTEVLKQQGLDVVDQLKAELRNALDAVQETVRRDRKLSTALRETEVQEWERRADSLGQSIRALDSPIRAIPNDLEPKAARAKIRQVLAGAGRIHTQIEHIRRRQLID